MQNSPVGRRLVSTGRTDTASDPEGLVAHLSCTVPAPYDDVSSTRDGTQR
jgi:hypothetical protein